MSELNFEIRAILRHYWKQGYKATEAARKICDVEGDGTVEIRAAQIWFKKFKNGDTSLEDKRRCGHSFLINPEAVRGRSSHKHSEVIGRARNFSVNHCSPFAAHWQGQQKLSECSARIDA